MKVILASAAVAVLPLLFAGGARAQDAGGRGPAPTACYVRDGGGSFSQRVRGGALHAGDHDQAVIVGVTHAFGG